MAKEQYRYKNAGELKGWGFIRTPLCGLKARGLTFEMIQKAFSDQGWDCRIMGEFTDENDDNDIIVIRESDYRE